MSAANKQFRTDRKHSLASVKKSLTTIRKEIKRGDIRVEVEKSIRKLQPECKKYGWVVKLSDSGQYIKTSGF